MSLLRPYLPGGTHYRPPDTIVTGENQEYEVERIVSHKKTSDRLVYQVRWRGYDAMEDNCLREEDLTNASDHLQAFQLRHVIDLFDMLLTSGACRTPRVCHCTFQTC